MVFSSYRKLCNCLLETHGSLSRTVTIQQQSATRVFSAGKHPGLFGLWAAKYIAAQKIPSARPFCPNISAAASPASPLSGTRVSLSLIRHLDWLKCLPLLPVLAGASVLTNIDRQIEDVFETTSRRFN